ncbi:hypothetical protein JOM56_001730 [Amanita muscaria]
MVLAYGQWPKGRDDPDIGQVNDCLTRLGNNMRPGYWKVDFYPFLKRREWVEECSSMLAIGVCSYITASSVSAASGIPFLSGLDSFSRIAGFVAIIPAARWMSSNFLETKSGLERSPHDVGGEGLLMLLVCLSFAYSDEHRIIGFVTGVMLYALEGAALTDASAIVRQSMNTKN